MQENIFFSEENFDQEKIEISNLYNSLIVKLNANGTTKLNLFYCLPIYYFYYKQKKHILHSEDANCDSVLKFKIKNDNCFETIVRKKYAFVCSKDDQNLKKDNIKFHIVELSKNTFSSSIDGDKLNKEDFFKKIETTIPFKVSVNRKPYGRFAKYSSDVKLINTVDMEHFRRMENYKKISEEIKYIYENKIWKENLRKMLVLFGKDME